MQWYRVNLRIRPPKVSDHSGCSSPQNLLGGDVFHEIDLEIHANQVFIIDCIAFDFHDKLGYIINKSGLWMHIVR